MTSFTINIQVADVVKTLTIIEAAFKDPSDLMTDVLLVMIRSTQQTFEAQGRPQRWFPHAQATIDARLGRNAKGRAIKSAANRKDVFGKEAVAIQNSYFAAVGEIKILRDTGLLAISLGANASGAFEAADGFGESDKFTATLGTNRPGAEALQLVIAGGRVYLLFQEEDPQTILIMGSDWFLRVGPYAA